MPNYPTWIPVVAGLIGQADGRVLLQQVPAGKRHAGFWEFPGGKVEREENPRVALCRELAEELDLAVDAGRLVPLAFADEAAEDGRPALVLFLYDCIGWTGEPSPQEGQAFGWFSLAEAHALPLPPMDRVLLESLAGRGIANLSAPPYVAPSKRARSSAG